VQHTIHIRGELVLEAHTEDRTSSSGARASLARSVSISMKCATWQTRCARWRRRLHAVWPGLSGNGWSVLSGTVTRLWTAQEVVECARARPLGVSERLVGITLSTSAADSKSRGCRPCWPQKGVPPLGTPQEKSPKG
jgi:hypothetical protein